MIPAIIAVVAVPVLALLGAYVVLFRRPLPRVSGEMTVDGVDGPVVIRRDGFGVPHIEAGSMRDAAFAIGYAHAQDRGWQLELNRRVASGRISEFAGTEALEADRFLRRVGLLRVAEEEERLLGGEARVALEAYSAGVNAVLRTQPRPVELVLLGLHPEPWRPAHTLSLVKLLALGLALNMDMELQRLRILRALGPERAARLDLVYSDANPTILAETAQVVPPQAGARAQEAYREAARWIPVGTAAAASNNWVVDGSATATGRPMLCNDPHLPPSVPSVWYEAHLRAEDDFESAGVGFPGVPFTVIGHNRRCAWGFTNSFADVQDLVIEEFDGPAAASVRTVDGVAPCRVHREVIRVKGGADVVEDVVETPHGPVIERFEPGADGKHRGLALQWTSLRPNDSLSGLLEMQRATDWPSFRAAVGSLREPSQNCVYADVDGHIAYVLTGHIPVRRGRASSLPVPGWTEAAQWERHLTLEEMPQVLDPPEHVIITANNRVVGPGFPHHISDDYMNGYRALRLGELLHGRTGMDAAFMARAQMDVVAPPAREVATLLAAVSSADPGAEEARRRLVAWNGAMDPAASEPLIYAAFMRRLCEHALRPLCGDAWRLVAGEMPHPVFGQAGNLVGRITPGLLQRWRDGDEALFDGATTWPEVARRALEDAVRDLRSLAGPPRTWRWGRTHAMPLAHALGVKPLLRMLLGAGRIEVGGDTDTVMQTAYVADQPYQARGWAPSWRQILDVGDWDACTGVHLPGQSGHPGSRHFRDFVERWRRNLQHPLHWSPGSVRAATRSTLVLRPRSAAAASSRETREAA